MKTLLRRTRRAFLLAACGCVALALLAGCEGGGGGGGAASGHDFGQNDPNLYVAMGDSITAGGWPGILSAKLGSPVVNRGTPGAQSSRGAAEVSGTLSRYRPGYLLILYGANDAIHQLDPAGTEANLRAMIGAAQANNTIPIIGTVTPMYGDHSQFTASVDELNRHIRSVASATGTRVADLHKGFGGNMSLISADGLHPTPAGQDRIASIFYGRVK